LFRLGARKLLSESRGVGGSFVGCGEGNRRWLKGELARKKVELNENEDGERTDLLPEHLPLEPRKVFHGPDVISPPEGRRRKREGRVSETSREGKEEEETLSSRSFPLSFTASPPQRVQARKKLRSSI